MEPGQNPHRSVKYFLAIINSLALFLFVYIIKDYEEGKMTANSESSGNQAEATDMSSPEPQNLASDSFPSADTNFNENTANVTNLNANQNANSNPNTNIVTQPNSNTNVSKPSNPVANTQSPQTIVNKNSNTNTSATKNSNQNTTASKPNRKTKTS
jgi:hypothetical protein